MPDWEAPAKVNLSLEVKKPGTEGLHPLRSLVQAVEWCDRLVVEVAESEDQMTVVGADLTSGRENLVWRGMTAVVDETDRPPLQITLAKEIPVSAGLGGGSSDAAAAISAVSSLCGVGKDVPVEVAASVGADVPFFLRGGTAMMEGFGEKLTILPPLRGFSLVVVVPPYGLATVDVYRRWDELDFPEGDDFPHRDLPPALRDFHPLRNDLTAAALDIRPELGDWMSDLRHSWDRWVAMSGSGPAVFGYFCDDDEAESAVTSIPGEFRAARVALLRDMGVRRIVG
jgi:4-diphosphocytidyl-2-C-methyl-D-erythritol kinase